MTGDPIQLLSIDEFAEKIKSKYPEYQDMDNLELATKIIEKYPITVIFIFAATIYFTWRIVLSLFIAALIFFLSI